MMSFNVSEIKKLIIEVEKSCEAMVDDNLEKDKLYCHIARIHDEIARVWPQYQREENEKRKEYRKK